MQYEWISVSVSEVLCLRPALGPEAQRTGCRSKELSVESDT